MGSGGRVSTGESRAGAPVSGAPENRTRTRGLPLPSMILAGVAMWAGGPVGPLSHVSGLRPRSRIRSKALARLGVGVGCG